MDMVNILVLWPNFPEQKFISPPQWNLTSMRQTELSGFRGEGVWKCWWTMQTDDGALLLGEKAQVN